MGNSRSTPYSRSADGVNDVGSGAFIRHRNIRMPRISVNTSLMPRVKSYSCSVMSPEVDVVDIVDVGVADGVEDAVYRTASCTALLQSPQIDERIDRRRQGSAGSILEFGSVSSPFRRQFLSLRSAGSFDTNAFRAKMRSYLELAKQKKDNIEQSLSWLPDFHPVVDPDVEADSWDDDGYTTTQCNDHSMLTVTSVHTSLSSGYNADLHPQWMAEEDGLTPPAISATSTSTTNTTTNTTTWQQVTTSGSFYMNWLSQIIGHVPDYVELRAGRLHLKLLSGQSPHSSVISHHGLSAFRFDFYLFI